MQSCYINPLMELSSSCIPPLAHPHISDTQAGKASTRRKTPVRVMHWHLLVHIYLSTTPAENEVQGNCHTTGTGIIWKTKGFLWRWGATLLLSLLLRLKLFGCSVLLLEQDVTSTIRLHSLLACRCSETDHVLAFPMSLGCFSFNTNKIG